ncbi:hypothetical protein ARMSODRAFT_217231 [Armillaria solidipes]|uniref:Uncharacterized protein n=1 Tax=Armillaria solidipes TaxID=1076256 RepID=A0A2H3BZE1_9AGAR|nr:hypothetical protein ARMSODRAFT_217231 [Armillaria solidipes]
MFTASRPLAKTTILVGRRRTVHSALPYPKGCSEREFLLSTLQAKIYDRHATPARLFCDFDRVYLVLLNAVSTACPPCHPHNVSPTFLITLQASLQFVRDSKSLLKDDISPSGELDTGRAEKLRERQAGGRLGRGRKWGVARVIDSLDHRSTPNALPRPHELAHGSAPSNSPQRTGVLARDNVFPSREQARRVGGWQARETAGIVEGGWRICRGG